MTTSKIFGAVFLLFVLLFGFVLIIASIEVIPQGHVGVKYSRSVGIEKDTLPQGWHIISPALRVTAYPVSTDTVENKGIAISTRDGKPLTLEVTYDYHNEVNDLPAIYNKFKGSKPKVIEDSWLKSRLKQSIAAVTSKYTILEVFQNLEKIRVEIQNQFTQNVGSTGFIIENVTLGNPEPDEQTKQAIQQVVNAQQELERLEIEKKQAVVKAEKEIESAKGDAEAKRIRAEGDAKSNEILKASLTPEVIKMRITEKWDGHLPAYTGDSIPFVSIPHQ